jgi:hypothetical protein
MNERALWFVGGLLAAAVVALAFSLIAKRDHVQQVATAISWLLRVSFLDFVKLGIFIKPWKQHVQLIGVAVWLILLLVIGRYIVFVRPKLADIPGPYIPLIGYIYLVSLLFMAHFALPLSGKTEL